MPDGSESGIKWWMRYVIVLIIGGGGIVAVIVAVLSRPAPPPNPTAPVSTANPLAETNSKDPRVSTSSAPQRSSANNDSNSATRPAETKEGFVWVDAYQGQGLTGRVVIGTNNLVSIGWMVPHPVGNLHLVHIKDFERTDLDVDQRGSRRMSATDAGGTWQLEDDSGPIGEKLEIEPRHLK